MYAKTTWKIIYKNEDKENLLVCPHCGDIFLHQYKTEVFQRDEDEKIGFHVTTDTNYNINIERHLNNNPSKRRDGLKVHFFCEICHGSCALEIYQHKGQTFIKFDLKRIRKES